MFNPIPLHADNPGPMTGAGNHTYLLVAAGGAAALIDAGVGRPRHLESLATALSQERARLERVLVTHGHTNHASGAPTLAGSYPGAAFCKYPWPELDRRFEVAWQPLSDGERVPAGDDELVALHTPGHAPDHMAFWHESSGTIFSGDLVVLGSSVVIPFNHGGDVGQYLASLERLAEARPRRLLPAHGAAIDEPGRVLRAAIEHRLARERQVVAALAAGQETVPAIVESIYDGLSPALLPVANESVRAHLEKLKREGRATEQDGRWRA